jgi:hypothetical protein
VAKDGGERIFNGTDDALRLGLAVELEAAVHAGDNKIEAGQHLVRIVERAIGEDVGFDALEDAKALAVALVEAIDLGVLRVDFIDREPAGVMR